jgi:hypothetical protein
MPISHRTSAALLCAISGLAVIFAMGIPDRDLILLAGSGAFIGGAFCARLFGHPGRVGIGLATIGAILSTVIGAALAGGAYGIWEGPTLAGIVFGPMAVGHAMLKSLPTLLIWVMTMTFAHMVMCVLSFRLNLPS